MEENEMMELFFEIHSGLPREGPGDAEFTSKAFSMLDDLPEEPRILDVGCGPGMQTLDLLRLTNGTVVAVDLYPHYLEELERRASEEGVSHRIEAMEGDMNDLPFEQASFDLIWAEGSIYIMGFEKGLKNWRPLLKPKGYIAVTEAVWLDRDAPDELKMFWEEGYPAMQDIDGNIEIIRKSGYNVVGNFTLPDSAWWKHYYDHIEAKLPSLEEKYRGNEEALNLMQAERVEIDFFRNYSRNYGYAFFIMKAI